MAASTVVRLTNGLKKVLMADIQEDGSYGEIYEVAKLTAMTAETGEGSISLAAGNGVIYSKKSVGKTSGSLSFYGMSDVTEMKLFDVREGKSGGKIYGMKANKGYKAVIIEATTVNLTSGSEDDAHFIFPKCSLGNISDEGTTKSEDGTETINTKALSFDALPLDNSFGTYKYFNVGSTPSSLTAEMFEEKVVPATVDVSKVGQRDVVV